MTDGLSLIRNANTSGLRGSSFSPDQIRLQLGTILSNENEIIQKQNKQSLALDRNFGDELGMSFKDWVTNNNKLDQQTMDIDEDGELDNGWIKNDENEGALTGLLVDYYVDLAEKSHESGKKIYDRDNPDVNKKEEESKDFSNLLKELSDESTVYTTDLSGYFGRGAGKNVVNEELSQARYAGKVANILNSNVYGSQKRKYYSKDQLITRLSQLEGIKADLPGEQGNKKSIQNAIQRINKITGGNDNIRLFSLETEEIDKDNLIDVIAGIPLDRNKPKSARVTALFTGAGIKIDPNL